MNKAFKVTEVVALLRDAPSHGLKRGQVGTIVDRYKSGRFEVEFADQNGETYAMVTLPASALLRLSYNRTKRRARAA